MNKIILFLLVIFATSASTEELDNRQALILTEPQRNHVLGEMRTLLSGIQNILAALAKNDMMAVAHVAKPLGTSMAQKAENHLHGVLPKAFMQMGMSVHKDFDLIAADAEALKDPKHTLQQLSDAMIKCTACHAAYQIRPSLEHTVKKTNDERLNQVAQRGKHVMPFNLEQTTHVFSKTGKGGVQQVIVKDPANSEQINLIRGHLAKISNEFKHGDFSNPAKIHGDTMPGLSALRKAKQGQINIEYKALADGAEINYSSDYPGLITAIHQWFDAQLSDHAHHAISGHSNHSMHSE